MKVACPLFKVLRLVDGEKNHLMGYIYEAMDRTRETIARSFNHHEKRHDDVLNPKFFHMNRAIKEDQEVVTSFYNYLRNLVPSIELQDKIENALLFYKNAEDTFGSQTAVRNRSIKAPSKTLSYNITEN